MVQQVQQEYKDLQDQVVDYEVQQDHKDLQDQLMEQLVKLVQLVK